MIYVLFVSYLQHRISVSRGVLFFSSCDGVINDTVTYVWCSSRHFFLALAFTLSALLITYIVNTPVYIHTILFLFWSVSKHQGMNVSAVWYHKHQVFEISNHHKWALLLIHQTTKSKSTESTAVRVLVIAAVFVLSTWLWLSVRRTASNQSSVILGWIAQINRTNRSTRRREHTTQRAVNISDWPKLLQRATGTLKYIYIYIRIRSIYILLLLWKTGYFYYLQLCVCTYHTHIHHYTALVWYVCLCVWVTPACTSYIPYEYVSYICSVIHTNVLQVCVYVRIYVCVYVCVSQICVLHRMIHITLDYVAHRPWDEFRYFLGKTDCEIRRVSEFHVRFSPKIAGDIQAHTSY